MSRRFTHTGNERIEVAAGAIGAIDGSPVTVITLWKPNTRTQSGFITGYNASDAHVWNINPYSDGKLYFGASGFCDVGVVFDAGDGWRIDVLTHAADGGGTTHHQYLFSGGGWSTASGFGIVGDATNGPSTYYWLGAYDNDEACDAWIGAMAVYTSALTTSDITTTGIESALSNWRALAPAAMWAFNTDDVASGVVDLMGNGADEITHSATSFDADEPSPFDYTLGPESLFTSQTPSFTDGTDGTPSITLGTTLTFSTDGSVSGIRFFTATSAQAAGGTYTVQLWALTSNTTGTKIGEATVDASTLVSGAWNVVDFASPVAVVTGTNYRVALHTGDSGRYVATNSFFVSTSVTNGHLYAPADGETVNGMVIGQGTFYQPATTSDLPRDTSATPASYFVDAVYQVAGGTTDATINASTIAAVAALPAATESAGSTVSPSAIAASTALPAGAVSTGSTVSPAVVAATAATPAAGAQTGSTVTPAVVAAVAALPAVHVIAGSATVYVRIGGSSVQLALRGAVRLDGTSVAFG